MGTPTRRWATLIWLCLVAAAWIAIGADFDADPQARADAEKGAPTQQEYWFFEYIWVVRSGDQWIKINNTCYGVLARPRLVSDGRADFPYDQASETLRKEGFAGMPKAPPTPEAGINPPPALDPKDLQPLVTGVSRIDEATFDRHAELARKEGVVSVVLP